MNESYIDLVVREFRRLQKLADGAISQMRSDDFFASPHTSDNSAAVIVKHVAGNMISRWTDFLTSDGEKPNRERDLRLPPFCGQEARKIPKGIVQRAQVQASIH